MNSRNINCIYKFILLTTILLNGQTVYAQLTISDLPTPPTTYDPARIKGITPSEEPQSIISPKKILETKEQVIPKQQEGADNVKFKLSAIIIDGVTIYKKSDLAKIYKPYIGKDVSLTDLQNIANAITARYREDGYIISRAVIPAQRIIAGKTHIQVLEGYVGAIYVEGQASDKLRARIEKYGEAIKKMRPLQVKKLERYVHILNDVTGLTVKTVLSPSQSMLGAADLIFVVERKRLSAEIDYDNRGSRYMGPDEIIAVGTIGDVVFATDYLSIQTIDTPIHDELRFFQLSYDAPIGIDGLRIKANASLTETRPGFILKVLDLVGRSKNWDIGFEYPILRTRAKNFWIFGKFDWIDSDTNFAIETLFRDHLRSIRVGASYDFVDNWHGANLINLEFSKGLRIFGASPLEPKTSLSRFLGNSAYKKINIDLSRYQFLSDRWLLLAAVTGQYGFKDRLLSAEEFAFGGPKFGRAYDPSEIVGDSGIAGKLELRVNTFPGWKFLQQTQYYAFYDIGAVWNADEPSIQTPKDSAANTGAGLRATFNNYFYGNLEVAIPLTRQVDTQVLAGKYGKAWRVYFGLGAKI